MSEQYIWYDTVNNKKVGPFKKAPYTIDGKSVAPPENIVELRVIRVQEPIDVATQMYNQIVTVDIPGKKYIIKSVPVPKPPPSVPRQVSPAALRLAMIDRGIDMTQIDALMDNVEDPTEKQKAKMQWEYALSIHRNHPLVISFGAALGLSETDIDNIFIEAELNYGD
jgi:hypothetical protein